MLSFGDLHCSILELKVQEGDWYSHYFGEDLSIQAIQEELNCLYASSVVFCDVGQFFELCYISVNIQIFYFEFGYLLSSSHLSLSVLELISEFY